MTAVFKCVTSVCLCHFYFNLSLTSMTGILSLSLCKSFHSFSFLFICLTDANMVNNNLRTYEVLHGEMYCEFCLGKLKSCVSIQ